MQSIKDIPVKNLKGQPKLGGLHGTFHTPVGRITAPKIIQGQVLSQLNSGSQVMSLASSPVPGNLLVAVMGVIGNRVVTAPTGWVSIVSKLETAGTIHAFYKIARNAEPNSYTFTTNQTPDWQSVIYEISGYSMANPVQFTSSNGSAGVQVSTLDAASSAQNVEANTLVIAALRNVSSIAALTISNSFSDIIGSGQHRTASRRFFTSVKTQNAVWTWTSNRAVESVFFGINSRNK